VRRAAEVPHVLLAAGLEPTGRVGLLADVNAVAAAGGEASVVVTAVTAQGHGFTVSPVHPRLLLAQLDAALEGHAPDAVKLGMVADVRSLVALWRRLDSIGVPVVVDPVVRTSKGQRLSTLLPRHYLALGGPGVWLTPNAVELAWLVGRRAPPSSADEATELAMHVLAEGFEAVVVKGGHLKGPPVDVLLTRTHVQRFSSTRLSRTSAQRGTGCRFASTLATRLALGEDAALAVRAARAAVRQYLRG